MSVRPRGRTPRKQTVEGGILFGGAITCFVAAVNSLGDGKVTSGLVLLSVTWLLGTLGFLLMHGVRNRWRWGSLAVVASLALGGALAMIGYLQTRPRNPLNPTVVQPELQRAATAREDAGSAQPPKSARRVAPGALPRQTDTAGVSPRGQRPGTATRTTVKKPMSNAASPSASQRTPLIGAGARVTQRNVSGPNVIAGGDVTINPRPDPNLPTVVYDAGGYKHVSRPAAGQFSVEPGESAAFPKIKSLNEDKRWKPLAELCETEISAFPEWLTPYLFAGVAYANLGDRANATERLKYFNEHARDIPEYADWVVQSTRLLEQLRGQPKPGAPAG